MNKTEFNTGKLYLVLATILGATLLFPAASFYLASTPSGDNIEAERARNRLKVRHELEEASSKTATTTGWVDEKAGIARIPVDRAIELTLPVLAASKPSPGAPLPTAAPAPPPSGAATSTNTPPVNSVNPPQGSGPNVPGSAAKNPSSPTTPAPAGATNAPAPAPKPAAPANP